MKNDRLEKALEETWRNKDKFYEDTKDLSTLEIVTGIENKYKEQNTISIEEAVANNNGHFFVCNANILNSTW